VSTRVRGVVVLVNVLLIVALVVWARGDEHHRGDDVGSSFSVVVR
jgi:hypothetical protein